MPENTPPPVHSAEARMRARAGGVAFLILLICLGAALGARLAGPTWGARAGDPKDAQERYWRAVYVLRSFGGPAASEVEDIPGRIARGDVTESMLHHPDRILVLGEVADELACVGHELPRAALYEAYARLALGERERGAQLLTRFVVEADFVRDRYALLAATLYDLRRFPSLYLICREWAAKDASCDEARDSFTFAALFNMGRYEQALGLMLRQSACLGWQGEVRAARAALAAGNETMALDLVRAARERSPADAAAIDRLWERLKEKQEM